jgi:integrase
MQPKKHGKEIAMNTKKAYASDLSYILRWADVTFENFNFPMTENAVLLFITDHLQGMEESKENYLMSLQFRNAYKAKRGPQSLATVRRRLFALAIHHREQGYDDPCSGDNVKHLLREMSEKQARTAISQKAITKEILEQLIATCDGNAKGIRDKSILLLAWEGGGLRRSEITAARVEYLTSTSDDDFILHIPVSKTRQGLDVPIKGRAAQALRDWLLRAAIKQGAIFLAVDKNGRISNNPLSPIDVNRIVKKCCKAAGLDAKQFGAHSLRSGFLIQGATE